MGKPQKTGPEMEPKDNQSMAQQLLPILQTEMEKAKERKDYEVANKLRNQVWVVTDFAHGAEPDMSKEELREILKDLPLTMPGEEHLQKTRGTQSSANSSLNRLKKLETRLEQIEKLKERQEKGETLEKNQMAKIENEDLVRAQITEMKKLMAAAAT